MTKDEASEAPHPVVRKRISAIERLRSLPEVFTTREAMAAFECDQAVADVMMHRWRSTGLIESMGPRKAGVHYNLLLDPQGPQTRRDEALWKLLGRFHALTGGAALHAAGWTTQRHRLLEVVTVVTPRMPTVPTGLYGIAVQPRPAVWMHELMNAAVEAGETEGGIPLLPPAWALADAILAHARNVGPSVNAPLPWLPAPDDVEIPDTDAMKEVRAALGSLGASAAEISGLERFQSSVLDDDAGWKR